jgi:hypothetical protein
MSRLVLMAALGLGVVGFAASVQAHQDGDRVGHADSDCRTNGRAVASNRHDRQALHDDAPSKPCRDVSDPSHCPYGGCSLNDLRMRRNQR